jgi:hypothetical protein
MFTSTSQILAQQHQTLARWRNQAALNAADMASVIVMNFRHETAQEIGESFYWDDNFTFTLTAGCAMRLGTLFSDSLEQYFARTYKKLASELNEYLGDNAPDAYIYRTELDALRREMELLNDSDAFKPALEFAKPSFFERLSAPDMTDDGYEAWEKKQAEKVIHALNDHVAGMESKLVRSIEKILLDAAEEYETSLRGCEHAQQAESEAH